MSSKPHSEPSLLELDLPTTEEDLAALQRARRTGHPSLAETLRVLSSLDYPSPKDPQPRFADGWEPFSLD